MEKNKDTMVVEGSWCINGLEKCEEDYPVGEGESISLGLAQWVRHSDGVRLRKEKALVRIVGVHQDGGDVSRLKAAMRELAVNILKELEGKRWKGPYKFNLNSRMKKFGVVTDANGKML